MVVNIYAAFNWSGSNDDANTYNNDIWNITGNVTSIPPSDLSYNTWKRWEIKVTAISSVLFWDFDIIDLSWSPLTLGSLLLSYNNLSINSTKCWVSEITYDLSWNFKIKSSFWWEMNLETLDSYYCPNYNKMVIQFSSPQLWYKWINASTILWLIFNASEVSVKWLADLKWNKDNLNTDVIGEQKILNLSTSSVKWKLLSLTTTINNNIELAIKNLIPNTNNIPINNFTNVSNIDKYYYYNYEWTVWDNNWLWNKWKNLLIQNDSFFSSVSPTDYQVPIKWKNIIIVKWWNVYINADIYNKDYKTWGDKDNLLVIVAKRDSTNKQNGGNIYVNPSVTNIDAVLIADWSLLSYDWTNALNSKKDWDLLRRQLLIHWSLITKNTIWENMAVYGTDEYIWDKKSDWVTSKPIWSKTPSEYYNLANFRVSNLAYASYNSSEICWWDDTRVIINSTSWNAFEYAFAWKRKCFYNDTVNVDNLRTVENKLNPLVIEYNPNIQFIKPSILKNN